MLYCITVGLDSVSQQFKLDAVLAVDQSLKFEQGVAYVNVRVWVLRAVYRDVYVRE